jgi:putative transposon-encoded protein
MVQVNVEAKEFIECVVKPTGTGACVYVPKKWMGKSVIVILKDE